MRKAYWKHLVNNQKLVLTFFLIVTFSISLLLVIADMYSKNIYMANLAMVCVIAFCVPVYLLHWMHNRKGNDVYMALPYTKKEMIVQTILISWLVCMVYFVTSSIVPIMYDVIKYNSFLFVLPLLAALCGTLAILLINTAIFTLANNIIDAILMIGAYHLLPIIAENGVIVFLENVVAGNNTYPLISSITPFKAIVDASDGLWYGYVVLAIEAMIAIVLLYYHFVKRKNERAEQLSTSILAYPFLITAYTFLILLYIFAETIHLEHWYTEPGTWLFVLFVFIANLMGQFVYRRSIRPTLAMVLRFVSILGISIALTVVGWNTKGFGLANRPIALNKNDYIQVYISRYEGELEVNDKYYNNLNLTYNVLYKSDDPTYQKLNDIIQTLQKEAIENFYDRNQNYSSYMSIDVIPEKYLNEPAQPTNHRRPYSNVIADSLTPEVLKELNEYAPIEVTYYDETYSQMMQMNLEEYINLIKE